MGIFIKLAWRNLFRNSRRTILASLAIGVGLAALIFTDALVKGMEDNMIQSATASFLGEGQIHREGYRKTQEVEMTIANLDTVIRQLDNSDIVAEYTRRMMSFGMATSPSNVQAVNIVGVDPAQEQPLSQIDEAVVEGNYFIGNNSRDILIGKELAEILKVELGKRLVVTLAEAETGDLVQEMFRISGIFRFGIDEMDRGMAFIRLPKAQSMLGLQGEAHEIAIKFSQQGIGQDQDNPFWRQFSKYGNEALGWIELQPQLASMMEYSRFSTFFVGIILFGVVVLGIINTLFMSLHERMFEFGVLRAVGTKPVEMGKLIVYEAAALSVVSIIVGIVLGYLITWITMVNGIDYTGIQFAGVTFRKMLYPVMTWRQFVEYPVYVFLFTSITGLYPAWYAARMQPAEAMRKSF
ncbi:MAG: FtsX-like permease family protein [Candidatus Marinimicrobia bacterium]|nr:FtsX-like permease family protein [Candidatus Neomarinimicrobiota bacterium]MCF7828516.1 FtsX-like permease family protein [Candidatus Neomarinimicrobiota bacterium]MCF7882061.1 FtsX-like permease family protein [Candidatus Neomarinimicrobiota bacterium]